HAHAASSSSPSASSFVLVTRPPPCSTLFPYTTLFRSIAIVGARKPDFFSVRMPAFEVVTEDGLLREHVGPLRSGHVYVGGNAPRSEEHTSELQSRENLVCRLLLEKKKERQHQRHLRQS